MKIFRSTTALLLLAFAFAPAAWPCHLDENLRKLGHEFTAAQLALLSHGGAERHQVEYALAAPSACIDGTVDIFPCKDVDLLAVIGLAQIGGGGGNDLWGWTDPVTGTPYAIVGRTNGTAFVDISDPTNPIYVGNLPTADETADWRDIKVYQDHAFVVADFAGDHGMQVVDLNQLRDIESPPATLTEVVRYNQLDRAHNLFIHQETGYAYAVGSDTCNSGLHMIDIRTPASPSFAGCFSADGYTHDVQCVIYTGPDVEHQGKEICFASNEDTVTIVDVTDKDNPMQLSRTGYFPVGYTHQGWLTEDQTRFVQDDELDEITFGLNTITNVWNVSDLDAPILARRFEADRRSTDHNQYVRDGYTFQANYSAGLRVIEIGPELEEVNHLDTYPSDNTAGFKGAWSTYPFFDNGLVLISDMSRGLFITKPRLMSIEQSGTCPGPATLTVTGATPGGTLQFGWSNDEGTSFVPGGACEGTILAIDSPKMLQQVVADESGVAVLSGDTPDKACGVFVQAVDVESCTTTRVWTME